MAKWTDKDVERLKSLYETMSVSKIAEKLGRTPGQVYAKIAHLGLATEAEPAKEKPGGARRKKATATTEAEATPEPEGEDENPGNDPAPDPVRHPFSAREPVTGDDLRYLMGQILCRVTDESIARLRVRTSGVGMVGWVEMDITLRDPRASNSATATAAAEPEEEATPTEILEAASQAESQNAKPAAIPRLRDRIARCLRLNGAMTPASIALELDAERMEVVEELRARPDLFERCAAGEWQLMR